MEVFHRSDVVLSSLKKLNWVTSYVSLNCCVRDIKKDTNESVESSISGCCLIIDYIIWQKWCLYLLLSFTSWNYLLDLFFHQESKKAEFLCSNCTICTASLYICCLNKTHNVWCFRACSSSETESEAGDLLDQQFEELNNKLNSVTDPTGFLRMVSRNNLFNRSDTTFII